MTMIYGIYGVELFISGKLHSTAGVSCSLVSKTEAILGFRLSRWFVSAKDALFQLTTDCMNGFRLSN